MSKIFGEMCVLGKVSGRCGVSPLERVADKTTKRKKSSCLEGGFLKRLGLGARERLLPLCLKNLKTLIVGLRWFLCGGFVLLFRWHKS